MNILNTNVRLDQELAAKLGQSVTITPVSDDDFKKQVADSTRKFRVETLDGAQYFLAVSSSGNPDLMKRAADNIMHVREQVSQKIRENILEPDATGVWEGFSYAVWPAKIPFPASGRVKRFFARRHIAKAVLDWNISFTTETLKDADKGRCADNLRRILEDDFSDDIKDDATRAFNRLEAGEWHPRHCYQHGDFWAGNIILPTQKPGPQFYVIDWAGMNENGFPFLDMVRMLASLRCSKATSQSYIKTLCQHINCNPADVIPYILCGLGHVGQNLEHFSPDRFRASVVDVHDFTKSLTLK